MSPFILFTVTFAFTFFLSAGAMHFLLPLLKARHVGQKILEIGPAWHKAKEGTPTMGGLSFVAATLISLLISRFLVLYDEPAFFLRPVLLSFLYALANAFVGTVDDLTKFHKRENEGLTPGQKMALQITFAAAYLSLMRLYGHIDTGFYLPFFNVVLDFGFAYYFFAMILCVGTVNCVNLTDGIDGLCASVSLVAGAAFAVFGIITGENGTLLLSALQMGACLGFLLYNRHPARVFMGDTGSLFLGGLFVGCGFCANNALLVLLIGGFYILEGVSVVLQVFFYKLTGRRLFRMAPFHHHLEKCGWSEKQIVLAASAVTAITGGAALLSLL